MVIDIDYNARSSPIRLHATLGNASGPDSVPMGMSYRILPLKLSRWLTRLRALEGGTIVTQNRRFELDP
jgi:hypothetical protein